MSVTVAEFKIRFPEFDSTPDATVQLFLDDAVVMLNESYWGEKYDLGISYYTAHCLSLASKSSSGASGSVAPVSGKAVDGVSVSFATSGVNNPGEQFYSSTTYGQRYLVLVATLPVPAYVI